MAGTVWFGTENRMAWIPAPSASGVDRSVQSWNASQQFLDGGQWRRRSSTGSRQLQLTWPIMTSASVRSVTSFLEGTYGPGPFYYCDPFAEGANLLPQWLAVPWLATGDAPTLAPGLPAPLVAVTPANTYAYPSFGATYAVSGALTGYKFPVPPSTTARFGWHGSATGTAVVKANGTTVTPLGVDTPTLTNFSYTAPSTGGWVELSVSGTGTLTLYGLHLSLGAAPVGVFVKGEGYVGLSLDGDHQITGYSSSERLDRQALTANFVETEASSSDTDYDWSSFVMSAYLIDPSTGNPYKAMEA